MKAIKINNKQDYQQAEQLLINKGYKVDKEWNKEISSHNRFNKLQYYFVIGNTAALHSHKGIGTKEIYENIEDFLASEE